MVNVNLSFSALKNIKRLTLDRIFGTSCRISCLASCMLIINLSSHKAPSFVSSLALLAVLSIAVSTACYGRISASLLRHKPIYLYVFLRLIHKFLLCIFNAGHNYLPVYFFANLSVFFHLHLHFYQFLL